MHCASKGKLKRFEFLGNICFKDPAGHEAQQQIKRIKIRFQTLRCFTLHCYIATLPHLYIATMTKVFCWAKQHQKDLEIGIDKTPWPKVRCGVQFITIGKKNRDSKNRKISRIWHRLFENWQIQQIRATGIESTKQQTWWWVLSAGENYKVRYGPSLRFDRNNALCATLLEMIDFRLTNCEIAQIDFSLLPKSARQAINQRKFFQIRDWANCAVAWIWTWFITEPLQPALDSAQLMKMHLKSRSN